MGLFDWLFDMFRFVIRPNEPTDRVIMRDHVDGSIWFILINDAGDLVSESRNRLF